MKTIRYCILSALLLLAPAVAWGGTCTFKIGYSGYTDGTVEGAGFEAAGGCTPANSDDFVVVDGATVLAKNDITIFGAVGWTINEGGEMTVSASEDRDPILFQGSTGGSYPVANTAWAVDGKLNAWGGYRQFGVETPVLQRERFYQGQPRKDLVWTIESYGVCGGAAGQVGANCATDGATDPYYNFYWTDAASNPMNGSTGDTWLEESIGDVLDGVSYHVDMWCPWDLDPHDDYIPGEVGQCYDIDDVVTATPYSFKLDMGQESVYPENPPGYPTARRQIVGVTLESAATAGDTCIDLDDGAILVDDDYVGRYLIVEDTGLWDRPLKIMATKLDVDCAGNDTSGGDASDSIYFSADNPVPEDIPVETGGTTNEAAIAYGFRPGDHGFVMVPVRMDETQNSNDYNARFYASGTLNFNAVMIGSVGTFELDRATLERFTDVYFYDCGASSPCMDMDGISASTLKHVSFAGGSASYVTNPIYVDGVNGALKFQDLSFRYYLGNAILTTGAGTAGRLYIDRLNCGPKITGGTSGRGCVNDVAKAFSGGIYIRQLYAEHAVNTYSGAGALIMAAADGPQVRVDKAMLWGLDGAMSSGNVKMDDVIARGIRAPTTSAILPLEMDHFDIAEVTASALTTTLNGSTATDYRNGRFHDIMHHGQALFYGGAGHVFGNIELSDFDTDATCSGGECSVFAYTFDSDTSTMDILEDVTFSLSSGSDTSFVNMVHEVSGMDADADGTRIGGLLMANITTSPTNIDATGIDFDDSDKVGYLNTQAGPFCFYGNAANGTGTWYDVNATPLASYAGIYYTGYPPSFEDAVHNQFGLTGGIQELWSCGARTGQWRPGVHHRDMARMWSQIGIVPPDLVTIVNKRNGGVY